MRFDLDDEYLDVLKEELIDAQPIATDEDRGRNFKGVSKAQRRETPLRCAHVAYETTCPGVGFGDPNKYFCGANRVRDSESEA